MNSEDILGATEQWLSEGRHCALATVIATWGSSPRPIGSQLLVDEQMNMLGSVSGGCIEGSVVQEAQNVISSGTPKVLEFGVTNDEAWAVGLACGGTVRVFVERVE